MKKIVRLTESDLVRIVKRVISEQSIGGPDAQLVSKLRSENGDKELLAKACKFWSRMDPNTKLEFNTYSKKFTQGAPFKMEVACSVDSSKSVLSDKDRQLLKDLTTLAFVK